jgi:hypothetical protein
MCSSKTTALRRGYNNVLIFYLALRAGVGVGLGLIGFGAVVYPVRSRLTALVR